MQGQWLQVLGHYLLIPQSPIFNQKKEDICQRVDLVTDIHQKLCLWEVYKCHLMMVM